jgi:hypothetical protein
VLGINHEEVVEIVRQLTGSTHVVDRFADGPGGWHSRNLSLHQPAGAFLRKGQALDQDRAFVRRQRGKDALLLVLVEILEQLDGVVAVQLGDRLGNIARGPGSR